MLVPARIFARLSVALCAIVLMAAGAAAEDRNTILYGGDYSIFQVDRGGWQQCERFCENDLTCQAWTYVRNINQCRLKSNVQSEARNDCCVSGTKRIAQRELPRQERQGRGRRRNTGKIDRVSIDLGNQRELICIEMKPRLSRRFDEACVFAGRGERQAEAMADLLRDAFVHKTECLVRWGDLRGGRAEISSVSCQR